MPGGHPAVEAAGISMAAAAFLAVVGGQAMAMALTPFLQAGFPVVAMGIGQQCGGSPAPVGREPAVHGDQASGSAARSFIEATDEGFGAFSPEGGAACPVADGDGTDPQGGFKAAGVCQFRQPAVAHELGAEAGAAAHAQPWMLALKKFGGGQAQHGIAEEFEPFVMAAETS